MLLFRLCLINIQSVDTAPIPCGCGWPSCRCSKATYSSALTPLWTGQRPESGLAALAAAAALCSDHHPSHVNHETLSPRQTSTTDDHTRGAQQQQCVASATSQPPKHLPHHSSPEAHTLWRKRHRTNSDEADLPVTSRFPAQDDNRGPQLPPLRYYSTSEDPPYANGPVPTFPPIPSLSQIVSIAGSGCCCGVECACPGCVEHRGPAHASKELPDCADGCETCVDNLGGVSLPSPLLSSTANTGPPNFIDAFFARAAALPLPPAKRTATLDATNVTVYPATLFRSDTKDREARGAAFGLVSVPPLQCGCLGGCGCPAGKCGCGEGCGGCC